jgi:catechol 2,3-dioxygenase-like lactoylglutathione lyase family enzyme
MRVLALAWVGMRTTDYAATLWFFKDVLGLTVHSSDTDFAVLDVEDSTAAPAGAGATGG